MSLQKIGGLILQRWALARAEGAGYFPGAGFYQMLKEALVDEGVDVSLIEQQALQQHVRQREEV